MSELHRCQKGDFVMAIVQIAAMHQDAVSSAGGSPDESEEHVLEQVTSGTRLRMVLSFLGASALSATPLNIRSGFEKSGPVPVNLNRLLESKLSLAWERYTRVL
jgi:hypothetical protein